jgi:hypothetical protein
MIALGLSLALPFTVKDIEDAIGGGGVYALTIEGYAITIDGYILTIT